MIAKHHPSERRACRLVELSRNCYRNPPLVDERTQLLSAKIVEIAQVRRRLGYRRIHGLLRLDFAVDYGISGQYVTRLLDRACHLSRIPNCSENQQRPRFTCRAFIA